MAAGAPTIRWPRVILAACVSVACGCATHVFVPPAGAGEPFPDAAAAWADATHACRGASTYAASVRVHGKVASESLNATIITVVTRADQLALSVPVMFGPPAFVLGGGADKATLWLPREKRVLTARADDIVEALTGLRLTPRGLLAILTGCVGEADAVTASAQYGKMGAITTADGRMFVEPRDGRWRLMRGFVGELLVEYQQIDGDWPRALRITTNAGHAPAVSLSMTMDQIDVNVPQDAKTFVVSPSPDVTPMTLDDLRAAGPLREKK